MSKDNEYISWEEHDRRDKLSQAHHERDEARQALLDTGLDDEVIDPMQSLIEAWIKIALLDGLK